MGVEEFLFRLQWFLYGLEFPRMKWRDWSIKDAETDVPEPMRLLYVAMTRTQEKLLLTASNENCYVRRFLELRF